MIWIYDINNDTIINKFGMKGKGPGEFLGIIFINIDSNILGIYDVTLCRITYYTIDKLLSGFSKPDSMKKVSTDFGIPYFIQKIDSNRYVASGRFHPYRYAILDRNLNIISTHLPVPQKLLDLANNKYTYSFYHSGIIYNDNLKRLAVGMKTYDMLQILNTDIEVIKSVHGPDHNFPDWTGKQKLSPEGYMPLTGSTHKIYGVYSGETPSTINDWIKSFGKNIHIFDWEGRPLKRIRTDYRIGDIVLSESRKRLYLVYYDEEYFRLGYIELQEDEI
ncbi:MAG: BF3164 family lipoprotein [Fidelibacterota bacterium]